MTPLVAKKSAAIPGASARERLQVRRERQDSNELVQARNDHAAALDDERLHLQADRRAGLTALPEIRPEPEAARADARTVANLGDGPSVGFLAVEKGGEQGAASDRLGIAAHYLEGEMTLSAFTPRPRHLVGCGQRPRVDRFDHPA